jgi:Arylsulfotransferase (ASST)
VMWQVGAAGDSQLAVPWCYQHDVVALGHNEYSIYDDGGAGPGCLPGSTQHPARALTFTVNPATNPAGVTLDTAYTHTPVLYSQYTGSSQPLSNGDTLVSWAEVPVLTEFDSAGHVKMDLTISTGTYRGLRYPWVGEPLTLPAVAASTTSNSTTVWASWNGSTQVTQWQVRAGPDAAHLVPVGGLQAKTGFETTLTLPATYPVVSVEALGSNGAVLASSNAVNAASGAADTAGYLVADAAGAVSGVGDARFYASSAGLSHLDAPIVGITATPDGQGYWLVGSDGGVFSFGDAPDFTPPATMTRPGAVGVAAPSA